MSGRAAIRDMSLRAVETSRDQWVSVRDDREIVVCCAAANLVRWSYGHIEQAQSFRDALGAPRLFRGRTEEQAEAKARAYRECYGPDGRERLWKGRPL